MLVIRYGAWVLACGGSASAALSVTMWQYDIGTEGLGATFTLLALVLGTGLVALSVPMCAAYLVIFLIGAWQGGIDFMYRERYRGVATVAIEVSAVIVMLCYVEPMM